jgi:Xaa-Pro aminopeptidase
VSKPEGGIVKTKVEPLEIPRFSLAEREQRWKRVRQLMERDNLDVLVVPSSNRLAGHARYLSGIGGNHAPVAVVFPRTGEVTALTGPVPSYDYWLRFQDWVSDIRAHFFSEGEALLERLRELSLSRGRIGLVGLADLPRLPEGVIPHRLYRELHHAFPSASLINATFLLDEARYVKSGEEIAFLQRSIELVEGAIETLVREAQPGVPESVVYAQMIASMLAQGGELPAMVLHANICQFM